MSDAITPKPAFNGSAHVQQLRTEAVIAEELRNMATPHLTALAAIMDEAAKNGMIMNFRIDKDGFNRHRVAEVSLIKPL